MAFALMSDILSGNWQFNFETIIIGKTGIVLDGQHRLVALVLAGQEYENFPDDFSKWKSSPEISVLVGLGAVESKEVVNTIGTGKKRSIADSLYASTEFGDEYNEADIRKLARMSEFCVRLLWQRTGAKDDAFNPRISHSDALHFIESHPSVLSSLKVIYELNMKREKKINKMITTGSASALLYLMSVSNSDPTKYQEDDEANESVLDFKNTELAEQYWMGIATKDKKVSAVVDAIAKMVSSGNNSLIEKVCIFVKGWNAFLENGKVKSSDVKLKIKTDENGFRKIVENPRVAGIDIGAEGIL